MARNVTTTLSIRDNYTAVIKKARSYTKAFEKDVKTMTERLDKVGKKKHELNVKNSAAMKALNAVEKKIAPIRNVMVNVTANAAHFKNQFKPVESIFRKFTGKAWTVTWKVKEGVTAAIAKIGSALKRMGNAAGTVGNAVSWAGSYAIGRGMELNQCVTDVPYNTGKVIRAGIKADQIKKGNTLAQQGLVKMAAMASDKTFIDAMVARTGAQEVKFDGPAAFGSGTEELAKNTANLVSVFTGRLKGKTKDNGLHAGQEKMPFLMRVPDTALPGAERSFFVPAIRTGNTGATAITTALQSRNLIQFATNTNQKAWENLSNTMPATTNGTGSSASGSSGESPAKDKNEDNDLSSFFANPQVTVDTIFKALSALAWLSKKGRKMVKADWAWIKNTAQFYWPAIKDAGETAWTAIKSHGAEIAAAAAAAKAAAADAAAKTAAASGLYSSWVTNAANSVGNFLASGGGMFTAAFGTWMGDQMRALSSEYYAETGKFLDETSLTGQFDLIYWKFLDKPFRYIETMNMTPDEKKRYNETADMIFEKKWEWGAQGWQKFWSGELDAKPLKDLLFPPKPIVDTISGAQPNIDVKNALKSTPSDKWVEIAPYIKNNKSDKYSPWNLETMLGYLNQVRKHGGVNLGSVHPATKAAGIKRVPIDNYPALLHKGEAVLPSGEAGEYRRLGNMAGRASNNISLNITVNGANMDENRLASILVSRLQDVALNMA